MSEPTARLRVPPHGSSVAATRSFVAETLSAHGLSDLADDATLAVAELVTNAVLHARTEVEVVVDVEPTTVRVTVRDDDRTLPVLRDFGSEATTGRGLAIVQALAADVGALTTRRGKAVWFTLDRVPTQPGSPEDRTGLPTVPSPPAPRRSVAVLEDLPVALWQEARRHEEAALRELVLVRGDHLPETVDAWAWFSDATTAHADLDAAVEHALTAARPGADGDAPATLRVEVPVTDDLARRTAQLLSTLDEAEALAAAGTMLMGPARPELVALRTWRCDEVVTQAAGGAATPWPGAAPRGTDRPR
ncbi:ATP-binding protein [Cellulomonas carbonis]|uniref:Histidine kinase/HSP90-like ATPase domain-containing protein n=1 Tax=Cellulomonas carbonis T26 TaxID=947969 RepID=A0A0A0BPS8_9CELL|nr:ATP-binding protein [Cellulomonas carbonis]KGM09965.1 hypothetical protein N868_17540 [Cellulomonas carbonis T26]GGC16729.1 hypothetical protein GCM10010972_32590 [Cellulomonas carbonis]